VSVLLDTHVLLWWQSGGERLSRDATRAIDVAPEVLISALSLWEVATLQRLGRIELDRDPAAWATDLLLVDRLAVATLSPEAAMWAGQLDESFPGDPIDRLLYATARDLRIPLVTKDEALHGFAGSAGDVAIVW
jgi:PIN domain nuclease of toxin-antitoxin system